MSADKTSQYDSLPKAITEFVNTFMRAINTARLYSKGHDLHKKNIDQLFIKLQDAFEDHDFIFLGCAKNTFFFKGIFFNAADANHKKFLEFAHSLRISHFLFDKNITAEELEIFIELLSGAKQGEGEGVSLALNREHIGNVKIGLLDYSVFSTVQAIVARLSNVKGDENIWRQLIVQPAAAGKFSLSPEKASELTRLSADIDELKKLILHMDAEMADSETGASVAQRGALLCNFIQNLSDTIETVDPENRKRFTQQVGGIINALEPQVKTQLLGSLAPADENGKGTDVIHEIIQVMPDEKLIDLLTDGIKETGAGSACFHNLFTRALRKYREPGILLKLVQRSIDLATREGKPGNLKHWQHLKQLIIQRQETDSLNQQYFQEIEALASSIQMKEPMVEEEEMKRLSETLSPEFMAEAKARLVIDLMGQYHPQKDAPVITSLLENLREILNKLFEFNNLYTMGELMREVYLLLNNYPEEDTLKKTLNNMLTNREVGLLLQHPLERCRTFEPDETKVIDALCQLYPEKAGDFLLDILMKQGHEGPKVDWLYRTLASLGPKTGRALGKRLQGSTDNNLPMLLRLVAMSGDQNLLFSVEPLLEHHSHEIKLEAINTIGKLGAERSIPQLEKIISKKSWFKTKKNQATHTAAAMALAEIGTKNAMEVLQHIAETGPGYLKKLCKELL